MIAKKKQARGMLTPFRKYRERQARPPMGRPVTRRCGGAKATTSTTTHKYTEAEALVSPLGTLDRRIVALDFPSFSREEQERVVKTLTALKDTLDEALEWAAQGGQILS